MHSIDPYSTSQVPGPNVAALVIGRSVTRFIYSFSQWILVGDNERLPPKKPNDVANGDLPQLSRACQALESIDARLPCLANDAWHEASCTIRDCATAITSCHFHLQRDEKVGLMEYRLENSDPEWSEEPKRKCVDELVTPWRKRIETAIRNALDSTQEKWFELGSTLEQGLCRPDIFRFQTPFLNRWPVLRPDAYSMPYLATSDDSWCPDDNAIINAKRDNTVSHSRISYIARKPGDVVPERFWWADIARAWAHAGLEAEQLDALSKLKKASTSRKEDFRSMLIDLVEDLFQSAHFVASRGIDRLQVDLKNDVVVLDATPYTVDKPIAYLFHALLEGETSFAKIKAKYPDVYGEHDKLSRLTETLPEPIAAIISHGRGSPIRLLL
jgi:hypothetical protein